MGRKHKVEEVEPLTTVEVALTRAVAGLDSTPDETYESFWEEIITNPDGSLNLEAIKQELYDYYLVIENTSKIIDSITDGRFSKPNTLASHVIGYVEEYYTNKKYVRDDVLEILRASSNLKDAIADIKRYFS